MPRSRGGDGRGRNGNRQREKAPATPTDQPGLGGEEAKKSPVCDLIAEGGPGERKVCAAAGSSGDSEAPGEWNGIHGAVAYVDEFGKEEGRERESSVSAWCHHTTTIIVIIAQQPTSPIPVSKSRAYPAIMMLC